MDDRRTERISVERARDLLRDDGFEVTADQAKMILEFLSGIAEIVVNQYLTEE